MKNCCLTLKGTHWLDVESNAWVLR